MRRLRALLRRVRHEDVGAFFFRRGKTAIWFVPTLTSTTAPSLAEVTAGTELTGSIANIDGFQFESSRINTPNLADTRTPQIVGEDTLGSPNLTLYEDDASNALRTALAKGTQGYLVFSPKKRTPVATDDAEVWQVESAGVNREYTVANEAARQNVSFAVLDVPETDAEFAA